MQPMLAYRFLRKISDWTMVGFYSEVHVVGQENVPEHGPVILAATHHNEIIDIAALSVTIPYRRRICYWAKSSMFKNPFSGALLKSSGSIPVYRNPNSLANSVGTTPSSESGSATSHAELFKHTSLALAKGEVVGVFPEGTSYTEPAIVRVKEGAAWAAIEYVKAVAARATGMEEINKPLVIIPAAIVYTDKSRYQSRVLVRYGKPIRVDNFLAEINLKDGDGVRAAVKAITGEIYQQLKEMTINAPDWDTFNSAKIAAELTWSADLSMSKYIGITQSFVEFLSGPDEETRSMKRSLVKYLGLLHYTGITHSALDHLYPLPQWTTASRLTLPTVRTSTITMVCHLFRTLMHPNTIAFLPVFIIHLPGYVSGWLAARFLTKHDEEESKAQFKAIFGGLGLGLSYVLVVRAIFAATRVGGKDRVRWLAELVPQVFRETMHALRQRLPESEGFVQEWIRMVAITAGTVPLLWKWHNSLLAENLERWKYILASFKIFFGLVSPASYELAETRLAAYTRPPPPAVNRFIKPVVSSVKKIPPVSSIRLIRPLLAARLEAMEVVRKLKLNAGGNERQKLPKGGSD